MATENQTDPATAGSETSTDLRPVPTAATGWGFVPIDKMDAKQATDGSEIVSLPEVAKLFELAATEVLAWSDAAGKLKGATASFCDISYRIRSQILVNGHIDWAGKSNAYSVVFNERITRLLSATMSEGDAKAFRSAVRSFDSDTEYGKRFIVGYLAENDPAVKAAVEVTDTGALKLGAPARKALLAQVKSQKASTGKQAQYQGFDPADYINTVGSDSLVGMTKAAKRNVEVTPPGTDERTPNKPGAQWAQIRSEIVKLVDGDKARYLKPAVTLDEVHHVLTSVAISLVGIKDERPAVGTIPEVGKCKATLKECVALLSGVLEVLETKSGKDDHVLPHFWSDTK